MKNIALILLLLCCYSTVSASQVDNRSKPRRKKGQACGENHHCRKGLVCWGSKCTAKRKEGQSCRIELFAPAGDTNNDCDRKLVCWDESRDTDSRGEKVYRWEKKGRTSFGSGCPDSVLNCGLVNRPTCIPERHVGQSCRPYARDCRRSGECIQDKDRNYVCSKGKKGHVCWSDHHCRGDLVCVESTCQ
jgi:hypothetical protein